MSIMNGGINQTVPPDGFPSLITIHPDNGAFILCVNKSARIYQTMEDLSRDVMPRVRQELLVETIFKGNC